MEHIIEVKKSQQALWRCQSCAGFIISCKAGRAFCVSGSKRRRQVNDNIHNVRTAVKGQRHSYHIGGEDIEKGVAGITRRLGVVFRIPYWISH